jgi:hypothetical protein
MSLRSDSVALKLLVDLYASVPEPTPSCSTSKVDRTACSRRIPTVRRTRQRAPTRLGSQPNSHPISSQADRPVGSEGREHAEVPQRSEDRRGRRRKLEAGLRSGGRVLVRVDVELIAVEEVGWVHGVVGELV